MWIIFHLGETDRHSNRRTDRQTDQNIQTSTHSQLWIRKSSWCSHQARRHSRDWRLTVKRQISTHARTHTHKEGEEKERDRKRERERTGKLSKYSPLRSSVSLITKFCQIFWGWWVGVGWSVYALSSSKEGDTNVCVNQERIQVVLFSCLRNMTDNKPNSTVPAERQRCNQTVSQGLWAKDSSSNAKY